MLGMLILRTVCMFHYITIWGNFCIQEDSFKIIKLELSAQTPLRTMHSNYSLTRNNRVVKPYKVQKQILEKLCIQEESPTVGHGQTAVLFRLGRTLEKEQTRIAMCAQMHTQIVLKWHIVSQIS